MSLDNQTIRRFAKMIKEQSQTTDNQTIAYGTAVQTSDGYYVRLDGSGIEMPVATLVGYKPNDRVTVVLKDHQAVIIGNSTNPPMIDLDNMLNDGSLAATLAKIDQAYINGAQIEQASISYANIDNAFISDLIADNGNFKTLYSEILKAEYLSASLTEIKTAYISNANIKNAEIDYSKVNEEFVRKLTAVDANIKTLQSSIITVSDLTAKIAKITDLRADDAFIKKLSSLFISTNELNAISANIEKAVIDSINAKYANIDLANVEVTSIGALFNKVGLIDNATIVDGHITGYLDSVKINADVIDAGTLSVDRLIIKGSEESIMYQLNKGTVESEKITKEILSNYLHGEHIVANSITATQIASNTITATQIDVFDLFAQDIVATGSITGMTLNVEQGIIAGFNVGDTVVKKLGKCDITDANKKEFVSIEPEYEKFKIEVVWKKSYSNVYPNIGQISLIGEDIDGDEIEVFFNLSSEPGIFVITNEDIEQYRVKSPIKIYLYGSIVELEVSIKYIGTYNAISYNMWDYDTRGNENLPGIYIAPDGFKLQYKDSQLSMDDINGLVTKQITVETGHIGSFIIDNNGLYNNTKVDYTVANSVYYTPTLNTETWEWNIPPSGLSATSYNLMCTRLSYEGLSFNLMYLGDTSIEKSQFGAQYECTNICFNNETFIHFSNQKITINKNMECESVYFNDCISIRNTLYSANAIIRNITTQSIITQYINNATPITSSNIGSQSVNYANSAGSAPANGGNANTANWANWAHPSFDNYTWYIVGDDVYIGDHNLAGKFCIKGANGQTGIALYANDEKYDQPGYIYFDGTSLVLCRNGCNGVFIGDEMKIYLSTTIESTVTIRANMYMTGRVYCNGGSNICTTGSGIDSFVNNSSYLHVNTSSGAYGINWWASDKCLKTNVNPTEIKALDIIKYMNFVQFDWNGKVGHGLGEHVDLGLIANELENLIPEAVMNIPQNGMNEFISLKQINQNILMVYALKAIQELSSEVLNIRGDTK